MNSPETFLLSQSPHPFALCAILSLALHAGLLAGLGLISRPAIEAEPVPVVTVTMVPVTSEVPSESPGQPQPSMKSTPRPVTPRTPPLSTSSPSPLPRPTSAMVAIKPLTTPHIPKPLPTPQQRKVLKDHRATDALMGQTLMKMAKSAQRSSASLTMPRTSSSQLTPSAQPHSTSALLAQSSSSETTASRISSPSKKKILMARPPGGGGVSGSKVGIIRSIPPVYPRMARESGWEGTVIVRVLVRTSGIPGDVQVRKSSGHSILDEAAAEAVRKWRFKPEQDGNIPIQKYVDIPLKFDLRS